MGGKRFGFSDYEQSTARKLTRLERVLAQIEADVPWKSLIDLIKPRYNKTSSKGARPACPPGGDAADSYDAAVVQLLRWIHGGCGRVKPMMAEPASLELLRVLVNPTFQLIPAEIEQLLAWSETWPATAGGIRTPLSRSHGSGVFGSGSLRQRGGVGGRRS